MLFALLWTPKSIKKMKTLFIYIQSCSSFFVFSTSQSHTYILCNICAKMSHVKLSFDKTTCDRRKSVKEMKSNFWINNSCHSIFSRDQTFLWLYILNQKVLKSKVTSVLFGNIVKETKHTIVKTPSRWFFSFTIMWTNFK